MGHGEPPRSTRVEGVILLCVIIWAGNYAVAKYAIAAIDIMVFNALRFMVAALTLCVLFAAFRTPWQHVSRPDWGKLVGAGVLANVLYQVGFIAGLSLTTAGNSAVLLSTSPLWTLAVSARMHGGEVTPAMWRGVLASIAGVILLITGSGKEFAMGGGEILGDGICLTAALVWAFNTNIQKPLLGRYTPMQLTTVMVSVGAVGLAIIASPAAFRMDWSSVRWTHLAATAASGVLSIAFGSVAWAYGVRHLGPGRTGSYGNLIPLIALAISWILLGEALTLVQIVGAGLTVFGVWHARGRGA